MSILELFTGGLSGDTGESVTVPANTAAEVVLYSALKLLVSGRVYPDVLPDGVDLPAITYQEISVSPQNDLAGDIPLEEIRYQIDIWALTRKEAKTNFLYVQQQLSSIPTRYIFDSRDSDYEPDTKRFRVSSDFLCWHNPGDLPASEVTYNLKAYLGGELTDIAMLQSVNVDGTITIAINWPDTINGGAL